MKIRNATINPIVGDINGNRDKILNLYNKANDDNIDLLILPECCLSGYPPEDLMLRHAFSEQIMQELEYIHKNISNTKLLFGTPYLQNDIIYNGAVLIDEGGIELVAKKQYLPDYGVFDDSRIFTAGQKSDIVIINNKKFGIMICEDMWNKNVATELKDQGAECFISINASPYESGKFQRRLELVKNHSKKNQIPFIASFLIGGQDELIFDGRNIICDAKGKLIATSKPFERDHIDILIDNEIRVLSPDNKKEHSDLELDYLAMTYALRDYLEKNGFKKVVLGLSGGIDSAICATIAVDAIGKENVTVLLLPSEFTSEESYNDAYEVINALDIKYHTISVEESVNITRKKLNGIFDKLNDLTDQNIQSRLRGLYLMAYSNQTGAMLLTTGNKSEMAVGYATIYGDMCGGYNPIKDVYKTDIYALSNYRNNNFPDGLKGTKGVKIPQNIITKEPTAELKDDQKDSDNLPEYEILDVILKSLIEEEKSISQITQMGFDKDIVLKIYKLLKLSEYKRHQSPPGVKLTSKSFGKNRRYPITNGFCA